MEMTNPLVAATQFTAFMAMSNLAISFAHYWQGQVAGEFGHSIVPHLDVLLVPVPVALIPFMKSREETLTSAATPSQVPPMVNS